MDKLKFFNKKKIFIGAALLCVLAFFGAKNWITQFFSNESPYLNYPSLRPEIAQKISIRFDPSYYYTPRRQPKDLAEDLARKWKEAGVNLVFYRTYDPLNGAFYRTKYTYNKMEDFGKYNLLKYILKSCHLRGIQVYGWFPMLNHAGAWQAQPQWHSKTSSGKDYKAEGLQYPLSVHIPEVRNWWYGFLSDFLTEYPEIDGVDLGEPVVRWGEEGESCSEADSAALTELLLESTTLIHKTGQKVSVTTVQTAAASGDLLSSEQLTKMTGFDLQRVIHAREPALPEIICPEFIWQELKSRYRKEQVQAGAFVYSPEWTEKAVRQFLSRIDTPIEVLCHVEISDFPGAAVDKTLLKTTLHSAIKGGAAGLDVYSSSELDKKSAWDAIQSVRNVSLKKRCLVLYDQKAGLDDAIQIGELLRHFNTEITIKPLKDYTSGMIDQYHTTFYVGQDARASIPKDFISDIYHTKNTVCWLGFSIESLLNDKEIANALGIEHGGAEESRFKTVQYKNINFSKDSKWINKIEILDDSKCRVLATASDGERTVPYVVRSKRNFWYFADVPTNFAIEGNRFLVFGDLLHDILNENHTSRSLAMVRIEDVHPLTDPESLKKIASFLHSQNVPFEIALVPFYVYPEENLYVGLHEKPELVKAIKYMVKKGGAVVMHGCTHQRFGETTADYEFWDPVTDHPPEGENAATIKEKLETGLKEFWSAGIYPLMWETPHYAGSQHFYSIIKDYFSIAMERRQAIDKVGSDQYIPYLIPRDRYGQMIVPENMGYVPLNKQDAKVILEPARKMKAVRDGVASFFFHPFIDLNVLKNIIRAMKKEQFEFATIADLPIQVQTSFGAVRNNSGKITLSSALGGEGKEKRMVFPGILKKTMEIQPSGHQFSREVTLNRGELYAAHFIPPLSPAAAPESVSLTEQSKSLETLQTVLNFYGERCQVPRPLLLEAPSQAQRSDGAPEEAEAFLALFEQIGISIEQRNTEHFTEIPSHINLVLLPEGSAKALNEDQIEEIVSKLKRGEISLITSGFTPVSEELGIEKTSEEVLVSSVRDNFYPDLEIRWNPALRLSTFDSPAKASFIYEDRESETPLMISGSVGIGKYIFLSTPYSDQIMPSAFSSLPFSYYPYFLSHIFRSLQFFPLIRKADCEVYFNPAEREEDISIEMLVKDWQRNGVGVIYAAAWQVYPEWAYDYKRLIKLAHTNGMLVYAWFELPHVHDKFWLEHPEWREKNIYGEDVVIDWRKPMALSDSDCFAAVKEEMRKLLESSDWDGVVMNRSGWESEEGLKNLTTYTPFHPSARADFKKNYGYDPVSVLDETSNIYDPSFRVPFEQSRNFLAQEWLYNIMSMLNDIRKAKQDNLEIILTYANARCYSGLTIRDIAPLKKVFDVTLQLASRGNGQKIRSNAEGLEREKSLEPENLFDMAQIIPDSNGPGSVFYPQAPTTLTGTALYAILGDFIKHQKRFSIFTESSLFEVDKQMIPFLFSSTTHETWEGLDLRVKMPASADIVLAKSEKGNMLVDNKISGSFSNNLLIVPAGEHIIAPVNSSQSTKFFWKNIMSALDSATRLVDCSANLIKIDIKKLGLNVEYESDRRAVISVNDKPLNIVIDGKEIPLQTEAGQAGWSIMIPKGRHIIFVQTRTEFGLLLSTISLLLSDTIVLVSVIAILSLLIIGILARIRRRR